MQHLRVSDIVCNVKDVLLAVKAQCNQIVYQFRVLVCVGSMYKDFFLFKK